MAPIAVAQVRRWGGVLEHPAWTRLWEHFGMPLPGELPDAWGGITIHVDQVDYGHVARKASWLYLVGIRSVAPKPPRREPTDWVCGTRKRPTSHARSHGRGYVPSGIKICSTQQRRRTPLAFAAWLVELAAQMVACVERELRMRELVYARRVSFGRMTETEARRELATLRSVLDVLLQLAAQAAPTAAAQGEMFGGGR